ncbi:hypothetical protein [Actinophytocola sp.]|uniref:hypothetical protein n=1 Tax=Actinophytocola sp. TaxID=1872138 RepID=UPI002EDBB514
MTKPGNSDPKDRPDADEAVEDEPLMAELEKAPPPPEEPPVMPTAREAARDRGDRTTPRILRVSLYLWAAAGVVGIFGGILMLMNKQGLINDVVKANKDPKITPQQIADGMTTLLWMHMVVTVVFAVLFGLFAYKAQEGVRRARMMLTVVVVIVVIFYYVLFRTQAGLLSALLAAIATALMYTPAARDYFGPRPTTR